MSNECQFCGGTVIDGFCDDCGKAAVGVTSAITSTTGGFSDMDAPLPTSKTKTTARFTVNYSGRKQVVGQGAQITRRRSQDTMHTSTRRNALGGGLISLPDMPSQDPLTLLLESTEIPANKRFCPSCEGPVNRNKGYCTSCGHAYDFNPHLNAGDVIADKYEIKGPIAFGGMGWIYLGFDQVLQRWVILKGLLNTNDESSAAAAVAERRYLAAVKHPKIVGIYDFIQHGNEGFIIMEYVGGQTVHKLRKDKGVLPVEEAIAYILGILPAFGYLHDQGLVYCDFKPENLMLEGGDVKLVDMGAVRKIGDPNGDIYGTVGFSAPEATDDPSAVSDLYTLGRSLAVLIMSFSFSKEHEYSLPTPDEQPVLAENESLYRFLLRATHQHPDERFQNADEMADQLFGVLREIVAIKSGPKPAESRIFTSEHIENDSALVLTVKANPLSLPSIRVDLEGKLASEIVRILSLTDKSKQVSELSAMVEKYDGKQAMKAIEPRLRLAELVIRNPGLNCWFTPDQLLDKNEKADMFDWRTHWQRGLSLLMEGDGVKAASEFEQVYFELPGELAPRLAMGMAYEMAGRYEQAIPYYDRVGQVDASYISAHLGAARCYAQTGDLVSALIMIERVPSTHALYTQSKMAMAEILLTHPGQVEECVLQKAEKALSSVLADGGTACQIAGRLCLLAIDTIKRFSWSTSEAFLGGAFNENALRLSAEQQFRLVAKQAKTDDERWFWVEQANRVRPTTLI